MAKLEAPWTPDEVKALNDYQEKGEFHPYTCPNHDFERGEVLLKATPLGWVCPTGCGYTQGWAHSWSVTWLT